MRKVTETFGKLQPTNIKNKPEKIFVQNFILQDSGFLRSKKHYAHKQNLFYIIQRGQKTERVTKETLSFFKKILGRNILEYSEIFDLQENRHLKI